MEGKKIACAKCKGDRFYLVLPANEDMLCGMCYDCRDAAYPVQEIEWQAIKMRDGADNTTLN